MENVGKLISEYSVFVDEKTCWGELDVFGHINNKFYFKYFENVRVKYLELLNLLDPKINNDVGVVLSTISATFLIPLKFPQKILIGAKISNIQKKSFLMEYIISTEFNDRIFAFGESIVFLYNYKSSKSILIPQNLINLIRKIENKEF